MRALPSHLASVALVSLAMACAPESADPVAPQLLAVSAEVGVPVDVLTAVPEVPGDDLHALASVLADCAAASEVRGDDLGSWVPALECYDALQVEIADVIHEHGGVARAANEVDWEDATLSIPVRGTALTSCDVGRYCVYEHRDFGGRRLSFRDRGTNDLAAYGFRDKTSSWKNRTSTTVIAYNYKSLLSSPSGGTEELWREAPGTQSAYVGSKNDKADYLYRRSY